MRYLRGGDVKVLEAERKLAEAGFSCLRERKHRVWSHPDGRTVTMPLSPTRELYGSMAHKVRRYAIGRGTSYDGEGGAAMITMTFSVSKDTDGNIHVQNGVMGMLGQHHVHSPEGFERWRKPGDSIREIDGLCDCGLRPGQVRDHTGHVSTLSQEYT